MIGRFTVLVCSLTVFTLFSGAVSAADLEKSIAAAEGRKRGAENGARSIKAKASGPTQDVRDRYAEAATANAEWLEGVRAALAGGALAAAERAAEQAASSLVKWVAARNTALGEPVLAGKVADTVLSQTRQNLIDIASEAVRTAKGANERRRSALLADLERLGWRSWDEL